MSTCVPQLSSASNFFSDATRCATSIPTAESSGTLPRKEGVARPPPVNESKAARAAKAAQKAAKVGLAPIDGARVSLSADAALLRHLTRSEKVVADYLMKRTGGGLPGYACLSAAKTLRELGLGRRGFEKKIAALRAVLVCRRRGDDLFVFSEFAAWSALRFQGHRGETWKRTLKRLRTSPRPPVIAEIDEWWERAQRGGERRGLAALVDHSALFLPSEACGKAVDNPVGRAVERPQRGEPPANFCSLAPYGFLQRYSPSCLRTPPSIDPLSSDLEPLGSLDHRKINDGLNPLRSLGTRATQARAPLPEREPGSPAVRQEGPERISFVLERERPKPPDPEPAKATPRPLADTETRSQGSPRVQGTGDLDKAVSVSRGRSDPDDAPPRRDWISYPTFEAAFVRQMRATKPLWRFVRTGETVAALRAVWERFCTGKPEHWLEPWLDRQIDSFTSNVRQDGYQGPGFLRHMRVASVPVAVPPRPLVRALRKHPPPPHETETPAEVRAAILASLAQASGDP